MKGTLYHKNVSSEWERKYSNYVLYVIFEMFFCNFFSFFFFNFVVYDSISFIEKEVICNLVSFLTVSLLDFLSKVKFISFLFLKPSLKSSCKEGKVNTLHLKLKLLMVVFLIWWFFFLQVIYNYCSKKTHIFKCINSELFLNPVWQ